jgi:hypothetical protein
MTKWNLALTAVLLAVLLASMMLWAISVMDAGPVDDPRKPSPASVSSTQY